MVNLHSNLNFFLGDEEDKNFLIETAKGHVGVLNDINVFLFFYV